MLTKILIFTIFPGLVSPLASATDLKIKSMGQMSLIIEDQDNQLNLYDFGVNPAWLVVDQRRSWLRPFFQTEVHSGKFRRKYDPEKIVDFNAYFEGVKLIDNNQAFWGLVDYHDLNLNRVYQAINRDPYQEHPFRLDDNTSGDIHYWGPTVSAKYSRNAYHQKIFWGASLDYQIETGLKDQFPQPRTIYRDIGLGTGIGFQVTKRIAMGATFNYSNTQEFTEVIAPAANEPRTIFIMKLRGERIGTERVGSMEHFIRTRTFRGGLQSHFKSLRFFESAFSFYYNIQHLDATESRAKPVKGGTWRLKGYEIHWKNRLKFALLPIRLGLSFDHSYFNDWAIHPDVDVLLGDDYFTENRIGCGIAYAPTSLPLIFGLEYHVKLVEADKRDYVSRLAGSGNLKGNTLKAGTEIGIIKNWKVRAGYVSQHHDIDAALLAFSEFLADNSIQNFTLGMAYFLKATDIEFYWYSGQQRPTANRNDVKRHQAGLVFSMKFYRD